MFKYSLIIFMLNYHNILLLGLFFGWGHNGDIYFTKLKAFPFCYFWHGPTIKTWPLFRPITVTFHPYLANLRSKKQQPLCDDFMSVIFQVANQAAVGQVLHHQTHSEAPCTQGTTQF